MPRIYRNGLTVHLYFLIYSRVLHYFSPAAEKQALLLVKLPDHITSGLVKVSLTLETEALSLYLLHIHICGCGLWTSLLFLCCEYIDGWAQYAVRHNSMSSSPSISMDSYHLKLAELGSHSISQFPHLFNGHNNMYPVL